MRRLRFMIQKEMLSLLKDPRLRFIIVMGALIQGFLFGYAANYNLERVPYAILDLSHSQSSTELLKHINHTSIFTPKAVMHNVNELNDLINSETVILGIVIPEDFENKLTAGGVASVQVIIDGRNASTAGMAAGYVNQIINSWHLEKSKLQLPVTVESRTWYNPNQISRWNFIPSLIGMIPFVQIMILSGMSIAKEREQGTFDQLLVTPLSQIEILIGKAIPPMIVGLIQSAILFCICWLWFDIPFAGSFGTILLVLIVFALSATGIGLIISSIANNMQQVLVYILVTLLPLVLLSGIATPINNMPEILQIVTTASPLRYAVDSIRRIYLEGATFTEISGNMIPMLIVASITLPIAAWLFRNKAQ